MVEVESCQNSMLEFKEFMFRQSRMPKGEKCQKCRKEKWFKRSHEPLLVFKTLFVCVWVKWDGVNSNM